jgi:hypothetical protein
MMSSELANAFYKKSKVILTMPLGSEVQLGSVGYFDDGEWIEVATTETMFGLTLSAAPGSGQPNNFDGKGGKGFKFETKLDGQTSELVSSVADAHARAEITFGSQGAFVMNVKNQTVAKAGALGDLMAAIRYAYRFRDTLLEGQRWEKKYGVVVGIASAESVTALSAASKDASAVISGGSSLPAPQAAAELHASMKVSFSRESVDQLWQGPAARYAFQALKIDPSIFKRWDREDFGYFRPREVYGGPSKPRRLSSQAPHSYSRWARATKLDPLSTSVVILGPSGRTASKSIVKDIGRERRPHERELRTAAAKRATRPRRGKIARAKKRR